MTREETISALTADILERDGDTYVLKGTKNRLGWDEGLTGRYSARIVECKDPLEAIRHGVTLARNMVTAMNLPTAFTLHVDRDSNCTDGANIWLSTKVFDEKDMDPNDRLDVFIGLAVHEGSHILYSKFGDKATRDHRLVKHLDNLYEDERIERLTGEANPGLANFLAATKNYMFGTLSRRRSDKDTKAILREESATCAIGTDLLKIVNTILAMVRYPKVLDEDSLVRFADILMKVRGIIIPYPDSPETVREAALKTYDLLREYVTDRVTEEMREEIERDLEDEEDPEEEPGEDEKPEEENDERGDEDRDEPDEPDERDEDEKMEIPGDSCGEGGEPASGEGSDGNSGENPGEGSGEGSGEGAGENSDGGLREGSGDDADGNDGGSREERIRERVEEILGERQDEIEDRIEAILGELLEEMDGAMQVIAVPMNCAPDGMLPENTNIEVSSAIRSRIQAKYCESGAMKGVQPRTWFTGPEESVSRSDYNASAQRLRALVTPVEKALKKHFRDVKLVSRGMRSGHLDTSKLAEASLGVETVYTQHGTVRTDSIAVAILIDQSGSMYGSSIAAASDCAVLLQEAMERIPQIQLFIYGHTADTRDGADTKIMIYREGGTRKNMEIARCRAMSNNRDGYAIREVAQRVRQKTALPVLMFVLSDGMPAALGYDGDEGVEDTRKAVQEVTRMGFSPVQIAIDHYVDPKRMFDNWLILTKLETLAHDLSRAVSAALVKNTKIRRA